MGAQIKFAGYDAIVLSGKAEHPVYLLIRDDQVELRPAKHLWGKDIYDVTDKLWSEHPQCGVLAIGQSGENHGNLALALMDKVAATGKGGLGAVMGSKNLKAICVSGTRDVTVADPGRYMKTVNHYFDRIRKYPLHSEWITLGMQRTWSDVMKRKGFYRPYGSELVPSDTVDRLCGISAYQDFKKATFACVSCPLADKVIIDVKEGDPKGQTIYSSSFSAKTEPFVTVFNLSSTRQALWCVDRTNRDGLDHHDLIGVSDLVIHLFERGVISGSDTGGVRLRRDFDTAQRLIQWTAQRRGIGDVMIQGIDAVCKAFGLDWETESLAIKGWRPYFDPRVTGMGTMEFEMVVNPRGAHHTSGGGPAYSPGASTEKFATHANRMGAPDDAVERILDPEIGFKAGRFTRYSEDWYSILSSLGLCTRLQLNRFHSIVSLAELYSSATGLETSPQELARAGERVWNLLRAWCVRDGFSRKDDRFPKKWFEPVKAPDGEALGLRQYFGQPIGPEKAEEMLDDYYDERGWDGKTGAPTKQKLISLNLRWVVEDLERHGMAPA
jgi:aldehyde:ferredoxin oxidoreductase